MAQRVAQRLQFEWKDVETDRLVEALDAPMLVFHDWDDRVVPFEHGAAVTRAARHGTLVATSGLGHRGSLTDPAVIARSVAFLSPPSPDRAV